MKSITLGLALSLLGGFAVAQTPPAPKQSAAGPASQPTSMPPATPPAPAPQTAQNGAPGPDPMAAPKGPPEGMIVETPNGFYLVHPGEAESRRVDMGQGMDRARVAPGGMAQNGPAGPQDGDEPMDDMDGGAMRPRRGHRPMPPRPPESKGARFRIRTPNLTLGMKCPDDEPVKACIDAVSQLLDKASPQAH